MVACMRMVLVVAAAVAVACSSAISAVGSSDDLDALPNDSGFVTDFAFDAGALGAVYAATLEGGVYKSMESTVHWRSMTFGLDWSRIDAFVADSRRPATLYAGTGVAVYKTIDGGRSWRGANRGLLPPPPVIAPGQVAATPGHREAEGWVTALAVDPTDSDVVYAGTGGGVRKSTDGGRNWITVLWRGRFMGISALAVDPTSPRVVYAAGFQSGPADCGIPGTVRCRQSSVLYKTTNGGKTWRATGFPVSNPQGYPTVLALDLRRPTTLYAAAERAVLSSSDSGRSWQSSTKGLPARRVVTSLAVDPRRSGTVYAGIYTGAKGGVFKSTDTGRTWRRTSASFPVTALAVDPARPATIYAGVDQREHRIVRSTDSGQTWVIAG